MCVWGTVNALANTCSQMSLCQFLLLCPLLLLGHAQTKSVGQAEYWSYDRCSPHGPHSTFWPESHCAGTENSPIDLCQAQPFEAAAPVILPMTTSGPWIEKWTSPTPATQSD